MNNKIKIFLFLSVVLSSIFFINVANGETTTTYEYTNSCSGGTNISYCYNSGGCSPSCSSGSAWSKYKIQKETTCYTVNYCYWSSYYYRYVCYTYQEKLKITTTRVDNACSTEDKCNGSGTHCVAEGSSNLLRSGNCDCHAGGIYKACCKTSDRSVATSTNYHNVDGYAPYEANCSSGGVTRVNEVSGDNRAEMIRCPSRPDVSFKVPGKTVTKDASGNSTVVINPGDQITIKWDAGDIRSGNFCKFTDQTNNVGISGQRTVKPTTTTVYSITCRSYYDFQYPHEGWVDLAHPTNSNERRAVANEVPITSTQTLTVQIGGPTASIQGNPVCFSPNDVRYKDTNHSSIISWTSSGMTQCLVNGADRGLSGSYDTTESGTHTLVCDGKDSGSVSVTRRNTSHESIIDPTKWVECFDTNGNGKCEPSDACFLTSSVTGQYSCNGSSCEATSDCTGKTCYSNPQCDNKCGAGNFSFCYDGSCSTGNYASQGECETAHGTCYSSLNCDNKTCPPRERTCDQRALQFSSSKTQVLKNQLVTITWDGRDMGENPSCSLKSIPTIQGGPEVNENLPLASGQKDVKMTTSTRFVLTCSGTVAGERCSKSSAPLDVSAYAAGIQEE